MKQKYILLKILFLIILISGIYIKAGGQKVIFLHHSTGGNLYTQGNVPQWISDYNSAHNTHIDITERAYPDTPYPWSNYPYDYWNLWVNGSCNEAQPGIECIESLTKTYQVIIFKHCFLGAAIQAESGDPDVSSENRTLANYKLQYRALRDLMDKYPRNLFLVWTLVPLHRLATNAEEAARASEFVKWVKSEWLTEDGKEHKNIKIFDFWGLTAESDTTLVNGQLNCLKYDYEGSHTDGDSHPNFTANQTIGPWFAEFIAHTISEFEFKLPWDPVNINASEDVKKVLKFLYDIKGHGIITGQQNLAPDVTLWTNKVVDITGYYPGLLGEDFSYGDSAYLKREKVILAALDYWNKGGLVTISWHQVNPETWDGGINEGPFEYTQIQMSQEKFNQIFVPESDLQVKYQRHIDTIAGYLKKLQEDGVVVLWRPYHEMNGGWFWWGAKTNFADLWRGMYNRFTKYHHLNNLIWVWGPNISQSGMESYYPGDEYVDIVGLDGYESVTNWDIRSGLTTDMNKIISLSKNNMATITELGWLPNMDWLKTKRPEFIWFLCWWTHITDYNSERWIREVYYHDWAINRGDFLWRDSPIVLVNEFEDLKYVNNGTSINISGNINSHFFYPDDKSIKIEITADRNDIAMDISDSIVVHPGLGDIGKISFQLIASNGKDSIIRQFSLTLEEPVSINNDSNADNRISIYPNPATYELHIANISDINEIIIYDLSGRQVKSMFNRMSNEKVIFIEDLEKGYYTVRLFRSDGCTIRHFIKL